MCNGTGEDDFKFTADCKTPELIWVRSTLSAQGLAIRSAERGAGCCCQNDGMSQQFRAAVVGQLEDLYTAQLEDVTAVPALDEDFQVEYESLYEETCAALPLPAAPHASSQLLLRRQICGRDLSSALLAESAVQHSETGEVRGGTKPSRRRVAGDATACAPISHARSLRAGSAASARGAGADGGHGQGPRHHLHMRADCAEGAFAPRPLRAPVNCA